MGNNEERFWDTTRAGNRNESAYVMLYQTHFGEPCLSFDIIYVGNCESYGDVSKCAYILAGTQASLSNRNKLMVIKIWGIGGMVPKSLSNKNPKSAEFERSLKLATASVHHQGCVNRVRTINLCGVNLAAVWSEIGTVTVWHLDEVIARVDEQSIKNIEHQLSLANPVYSFTGHQQEGFAIDWNKISNGVLATGDCRQDIHVWQPAEGGKWNVDQRPLIGHSASVEDLQWSPEERCVLASCSVDKSIRIWDCRAAPTKACMLACSNAHQSDVNVIAWNRSEPFLASGGDDGVLSVWDLRKFQRCKPVASFKHHASYISTIEWHPSDATVIASGGADDQIAIWDLAIEIDENEIRQNIDDVPPQLLFVHHGQRDVKELHWHENIPGVILSTAHNGFNLFRTVSV